VGGHPPRARERTDPDPVKGNAMHSYQKSIGRRRAIELFESQWWRTRSIREIAKFQLFTVELCLPFGIFHHALEEVLGRPIWIHEFGFNAEGLAEEFLDERDPPTLEEIFALVPQGQSCGVILE
jgi:hypothetical protein